MSFWLFLAIIIVGSPIAKAVAARMGGAPDPRALREILDRLDDIEGRVMDTADRVADMDERLDFTERMLAQYKAQQQLKP